MGPVGQRAAIYVLVARETRKLRVRNNNRRSGSPSSWLRGTPYRVRVSERQRRPCEVFRGTASAASEAIGGMRRRCGDRRPCSARAYRERPHARTEFSSPNSSRRILRSRCRPIVFQKRVLRAGGLARKQRRFVLLFRCCLNDPFRHAGAVLRRLLPRSGMICGVTGK
jgi:hypothetical protein